MGPREEGDEEETIERGKGCFAVRNASRLSSVIIFLSDHEGEYQKTCISLCISTQDHPGPCADP